MNPKHRVFEQAFRGVIQVGEGRGFVVQGNAERYVITAANRLPGLPELGVKKTYRSLLAPLGDVPSVWALCEFVGLISDIAILCAPDRNCAPDKHTYTEEHDRYRELVDAARPIGVAETAAYTDQAAWVLSLDDIWTERKVHRSRGHLSITGTTVDGMAGSPIIDQTGLALAVVCGTFGRDDPADEMGLLACSDVLHGSHACLHRDLPIWLFRELTFNTPPSEVIPNVPHV